MAIMFKKTVVFLFLFSHVFASSNKSKGSKQKLSNITTRSRSKQSLSPLGISPTGVSLIHSPSDAINLQDLKLTNNLTPVDDFVFFESDFDILGHSHMNDIVVDNIGPSPKRQRQDAVTAETVTDLILAAINSENTSAVRELLTGDIDVNILIDNTGKTLFMHAIMSRNMEVVNLFLNTGKVNPNIVAADETGIFSLALEYFDVDLAKSLLNLPIVFEPRPAFKMILNLYEVGNSCTYFMISAMAETRQPRIAAALVIMTKIAVQNEDLALLKHLHSIGITFIYRFEGSNLAHYAANRDSTEIMGFLIETCGLDIDAVGSNSGLSALAIASMNRKYDMVSLLIRMGARVGLEFSVTASIAEGVLSTLEALLSTYENLDNFILPGQFNLLTFAAALENIPALELMKSSGKFSVNAIDPAGRTIFDVKSSDEMSPEFFDYLTFQYIA